MIFNKLKSHFQVDKNSDLLHKHFASDPPPRPNHISKISIFGQTPHPIILACSLRGNVHNIFEGMTIVPGSKVA